MSGSICLTLNVVFDPVNIFGDGFWGETKTTQRGGQPHKVCFLKNCYCAKRLSGSRSSFSSFLMSPLNRAEMSAATASPAAGFFCCCWGVQCPQENCFLSSHRCPGWRLLCELSALQNTGARAAETRSRGWWRRDAFTVTAAPSAPLVYFFAIVDKLAGGKRRPAPAVWSFLKRQYIWIGDQFVLWGGDPHNVEVEVENSPKPKRKLVIRAFPDVCESITTYGTGIKTGVWKSF